MQTYSAKNVMFKYGFMFSLKWTQHSKKYIDRINIYLFSKGLPWQIILLWEERVDVSLEVNWQTLTVELGRPKAPNYLVVFRLLLQNFDTTLTKGSGSESYNIRYWFTSPLDLGNLLYDPIFCGITTFLFPSVGMFTEAVELVHLYISPLVRPILMQFGIK
jgi:hypothetical protein